MQDFEEAKTERFPDMTRNFKELTDESPMPYGIHKDTKMKEVPASYLIWIAENNKCNKQVRAYITDNWDALQLEKKNGEPRKVKEKIGYAPWPRKITRRL